MISKSSFAIRWNLRHKPTDLATDIVKNAQNVYKIQSKANDYLEFTITSKNWRKTFEGSFSLFFSFVLSSFIDLTNKKLHNHFRIAIFSLHLQSMVGRSIFSSDEYEKYWKNLMLCVVATFSSAKRKFCCSAVLLFCAHAFHTRSFTL